jgi:hypothetical protein
MKSRIVRLRETFLTQKTLRSRQKFSAPQHDMIDIFRQPFENSSKLHF